MAKRDDSRLKCSFCGKTQDQVKKLIAGPEVYICDECVELCNEILDEEFFDDKEKALSAQPGDKVWEFVRTKLIEKLKLSGVSVIKDEETLDWLRHKPIEVIEMPEEGCSIEKTIYPGICLGEKVYLRAVVKLKQK